MDKCLHSRGTFLLHFICYMTVDIQSKRCCCMAQVALDSFDIIAGAQGCHCIGMSQIMETSIWPPDSSHGPFECAVDSWFCQVLSDWIGKHQTIRIIP